jgi:trehalose 2-sulfotransferase
VLQRYVDMKSRYVIASSPRTGSYLLCESLASTGVAGKPTEPFSPQFRHESCRMWALPSCVSFGRYLSAVIRNGTSDNGVFGVKLHWDQVEWLMQQTDTREVDDAVDGMFPGAKYLHLIRRDRRGQAISLYRAAASNEWWRIRGIVNPQITGSDPDFDGIAIRRLEVELTRQQDAWERYFRLKGVKPLIVEYETLTRRLRDELARILSFIGQDSASAKIPEPRLLRQADLKD